jgi:beta-N-acetylhexosaminidase
MAGDAALERLVDAILIPPFSGTVAPRWLLDALQGGLAGVTLFAPNMAAGPDALAKLTATLRAVAPDLLVAADEEGGDVTRVWYDTGSPYPGNAALGAVDDVGLTERVHAAIGADLAALGVNLDLAPCLDVLAAPENPVIGTRSFGADPALVARHGAAAVRGLQAAGVAACAKHFPGHGATLLDSHAELAIVPDGLAAVEVRDLPPFRAAVAAGVLAVMPGHLRVAGLTGELPASLSAAAITLLRTSLAFEGVVLSDALEMRAVSDPFGIPGAAVRAMAAGNDLLCLGRDVPEDGYLAVRAALCDAVRTADLPGARLEEAASRVTTLRQTLARFRSAGTGAPGTGAPAVGAPAVGTAGTGAPAAARSAGADAPAARSAGTDAPAEGAAATGGRGAPRVATGITSGLAPRPAAGTDGGIGLAAAHRALRLTGTRPELRDPAVIEIEPLPNMAAGDARWGLAEWVPEANQRRVAATPDPAAAAAIILKAGADRSLILVIRDAHRSAATRAVLTSVLAGRQDTILVEMGLPYWQPPAGTCQTYLTTHGASRANAQAAAEFLGLVTPVPQ